MNDHETPPPRGFALYAVPGICLQSDAKTPGNITLLKSAKDFGSEEFSRVVRFYGWNLFAYN
jgi:hypothetical protein